MTLKELIYNILLNKPETRNSRALLKWEVLRSKGFVTDDDQVISMRKEDFLKWETDTVRRCSQQIQREDLLLGKNLIQPTKEVKKQRVKLNKQKGYEFIQGQFNPDTMQYEI